MAENPKVYLYVTTPLDGAVRKFSLINIDGFEDISGLFEYNLIVAATDNEIDFDKLLGKKITVTIEFYNEDKRKINGVVTKIIQSGNDINNTTYYLQIRPWLWELTLVKDNKIFQNKSVVDIITAIFNDAGYSDFSFKTTGSYSERIYCVQYNETSFNFVSRLMEEEGIFYFFEHDDDKHTLILGDDTEVYKSCPGLKEATMKDTSLWNDERVITFLFEKQITTNQFAAEDYNFETPKVDLFTTTSAGSGNSYKVYEYPGIYAEASEGEAIIKKRLEENELPATVIKGESYCRAFVAGYKFELTGHDRSDINKEYVLKKILINADQEKYINTFHAFPSDVQYRPPRISRRPKIYGTQTALVVGKSGEEIWTDEYGRIKVQFYWDRDGQKNENSSCWIRVAQFWASKSWGAMFIPRIGNEVVISFLEGNPDKPLVTGSVYNADQTIPYSQPSEKNKSTILSRSTKDGSAGNEIRYDDTKGSEEFFMHAQKDMNVVVENERTTTINDSNETLTVKKGDRTIKVETGKEVHEVKGTREVTVTGDETHTDKANFTHEVKGNYSLSVDGNLSIKVKGSISIKSDMDISEKAGTSISNEAGTSFSNKAGTTMDNKASISMTNDGGATLTDKASAMVELKGGIVKIN